jgi:hypothetical protein
MHCLRSWSVLFQIALEEQERTLPPPADGLTCLLYVYQRWTMYSIHVYTLSTIVYSSLQKRLLSGKLFVSRREFDVVDVISGFVGAS